MSSQMALLGIKTRSVYYFTKGSSLKSQCKVGKVNQLLQWGGFLSRDIPRPRSYSLPSCNHGNRNFPLCRADKQIWEVNCDSKLKLCGTKDIGDLGVLRKYQGPSSLHWWVSRQGFIIDQMEFIRADTLLCCFFWLCRKQLACDHW